MLLEYNETYYLEKNPDVAEAVQRGGWPSGYTHYSVMGKLKGRRAAPEVDAEWYLKAYPLAVREIAAGKAATPAEHYHRLGKFRGYLPAARARRPDNPAAMRSRFGGLWTDAGNARDIVAGRRELGQITAAQEALLTKWIEDGYVILPGAIPEELLEQAERELTRAYQGELPSLRFAVHGKSQNTSWIPEALTQPAKALDLHWLSEPIRELVFSAELLAFLHLIFERRVLATQTLGFWRGSAQGGHQDSAYVTYSLPMQFAAAWIALEDVRPGAGELFYHVGSHCMPEFLYAGQFKGAEEARRVRGDVDLAKDCARHIELIQQQAAGLGLATERFLARRGDVLVWSADLAHGGGAILGERTCKRVVTHYCPADVVPSHFELDLDRRIRPYRDLAFYSSGHYNA